MNVDKERGDIEPVMLSAAKHLRGERIVGQRSRCFAALSMTWGAIPRSFLNVHHRVLWPPHGVRRTRSIASLRSWGIFRLLLPRLLRWDGAGCVGRIAVGAGSWLRAVDVEGLTDRHVGSGNDAALSH